VPRSSAPPLMNAPPLAVNDSGCPRNELDCDATGSMCVHYLEIKNVAATRAMVQITGSLPGQESHQLVCQGGDRLRIARTQTPPRNG
jgi:hypothetical protein